MGKNVFILNGHQKWEGAPGQLNRTLVDHACEVLEAKGYMVRSFHVDDVWDIETEIANMVWADYVIFQFPVYWFSVPWRMKQYIDEIYMGGRGQIFQDDGRTRTDPSKKYGTGGLLQGRKYMLSATWNAPEEAFNQPGQLFDGKGVDDAFFWLHKAQAFVGMERLPTFACYNVKKEPDIDSILSAWKAHLGASF